MEVRQRRPPTVGRALAQKNPRLPAVVVRLDHPRAEEAVAIVRRAGLAILRKTRQKKILAIALTTDRKIHALNKRIRGVDRPTDELSLGGWQWAPGDELLSFFVEAPHLLGDVIVSLDTARRKARQLGITYADELTNCVTHATLHLLGHDHKTMPARRRMALVERRLLGRWGLLGDGRTAPPKDRSK